MLSKYFCEHYATNIITTYTGQDFTDMILCSLVYGFLRNMSIVIGCIMLFYLIAYYVKYCRYDRSKPVPTIDQILHYYQERSSVTQSELYKIRSNILEKTPNGTVFLHHAVEGNVYHAILNLRHYVINNTDNREDIFNYHYTEASYKWNPNTETFADCLRDVILENKEYGLEQIF